MVADDGASTRTDDEGRFVLSVLRRERRSIRASAREHHDAIKFFDSGEVFDSGDVASGERQRFEPTSLDLALAPTSAEVVLGGTPIEDDDPDAVLRWLREAWLEDGWSADAARSVSDGAFESAEDEAVARSHVGWGHATSVTADAAEEASCASCHGAEAALVAMTPDELSVAPVGSLGSGLDTLHASASLGGSRVDAPHASLSGGCLACHGRRAADGVRTRAALESDLEDARCSSCHGASPDAARALRDELAAAEVVFRRALGRVQRCGRVAADVARIDGALILVDAGGLPLGDCDGSGAIDGTELAVGIEVLDRLDGGAAPGGVTPSFARAALELEWLHSDPSHGAHQPALTRSLRRLRAPAP